MTYMRLGNSLSGFFSLLSLFFGDESDWAVAFLFSLIRNLFILIKNLSAECVSALLDSFCFRKIERGVHFNSTWLFLVPSLNVRTPKFCLNLEAFFGRKLNCLNREEVENRGTTVIANC